MRRSKTSSLQYASIDYDEVRTQLATCKYLTLKKLWEEYCEKNPDNHYSYSKYCEGFNNFTSFENATLRKNYKAGEVLFVDYSGTKASYFDPVSGEEHKAEIFVATMGCSIFTYCEATESQSSRDWIRSHINAFEYLGAVPHCVKPDNLKSAVTKTCKYDPDINQSYLDMARHYGCAIMPARPYKPKDKAKVEGAVLLVQRWILATLRDRKCFSLDELNKHIRELLEKLNDRPFQKLKGTRRSMFNELELPAMHALPEKRYSIYAYKTAKVNVDYHVEVERKYHSVPYKLIGKLVTVRFSDTIVEVIYNNSRVASHMRSYKNQWNTCKEHRPVNHVEALRWNDQRFISWGCNIGSATGELISRIFGELPYKEQGIRKAQGVLGLSREYSELALEKACSIANDHYLTRPKQITTIIERILQEEKLQSQNANDKTTSKLEQQHENVRGSTYAFITY